MTQTKELRDKQMIRHYRSFFIVYCIGGGFTALALVLNSLKSITQMVVDLVMLQELDNPSVFFFYIYTLSICILGIICGLKIANGSKASRRLMHYYLIPQIPLFSLSGFTYYFKLGLDFSVFAVFAPAFEALESVQFNPALGAYFNVNFNLLQPQQPIIIGVNLVPLILLCSLYTTKARRRAE